MKKTKGIAALVAAAALALCCAPGGGTARAGSAGSVIADETVFRGTELGVQDWRYTRGAGVDFYRTGAAMRFEGVKGDFALKPKQAVEAGAAVELDIRSLAFPSVTPGWFGVVFGGKQEGNSKSFYDIIDQKKGTIAGDYADGTLCSFSHSAAGFDMTLMTPDANGNYLAEHRVFTDNTYRFTDASGTITTGAGRALDLGRFGENGRVENATLRLFWGGDGTFEVSVRAMGADLADRLVVAANADADSIRGCMGGFLDLTFMQGGLAMDIADYRVYAAPDGAEPGDELTPAAGFDAFSDDPLGAYRLMRGSGNNDSFYAGGVNVIRFDETSDVGNPLLSRKVVRVSDEVEEALRAEFQLDLKAITADKRFGFAFGIPRLDGDAGDDGSSYLYFERDGAGYRYAMERYGEGGGTLIGPVAMDGNTVNASIRVTNTGGMTVTLNGARYDCAAGSVDAAGYLGFAQTGLYSTETCYVDARVTALAIVNEYYAQPLTPLVAEENFNRDEFNLNEWFIRSSAAPCGEGLFATGGALRFDGAGSNTVFASRYSYSNFELQLDLSDVKNEVTVDPVTGETIAASFWFGVSFGFDGPSVESAASTFDEGFLSGDFVYLDAAIDPATGARNGKTSMTFVRKGTYVTTFALPEEYGLMDEGYAGAGVTLRLRVIDGRLTVALKPIGAVAFTEVYSYAYENGYTPSGYVCLRGEGNQYVARKFARGSYYTVDNVSLVNADRNPALTEPGFQSNKPVPLKDYEYIDRWTDDYLLNNRL